MVVMLYVLYPLSLRNVEDLLFDRGVDLCHETVRLWWNRFGPMFAADALLIEGGSIGTALYQQARAARLPGIIRNPTPRVGKEERLAARTRSSEQSKSPRRDG